MRGNPLSGLYACCRSCCNRGSGFKPPQFSFDATGWQLLLAHAVMLPVTCYQTTGNNGILWAAHSLLGRVLLTGLKAIYSSEIAVMHWRLSEKSALGSVGTSQIEVFPSSPAAANMRWPCPTKAWGIARFAATHTRQPAGGSLLPPRRPDRHAIGKPTDTFAYQLDWQLLEPQGPFVAGVELWLSIQTDLLNTRPQLEIAARALGRELASSCITS